MSYYTIAKGGLVTRFEGCCEDNEALYGEEVLKAFMDEAWYLRSQTDGKYEKAILVLQDGYTLYKFYACDDSTVETSLPCTMTRKNARRMMKGVRVLCRKAAEAQGVVDETNARLSAVRELVNK